MLLSAKARIFVSRHPADFRRSYDGLSGLVRDTLEQDPLSGALFVFVNRRRDQVKILFYDRNGFAIFMKRLERGVFRMPGHEASELTATELAVLLEGFERESPINVGFSA